MSVKRHRFLYDNFIVGSEISESSSPLGIVTGSIPEVANGSGSVSFSGSYTGDELTTYTVEIDAPGDVGVATYKWRKTESAGFVASGILTSGVATELDNGVLVKFTEGIGDDFLIGDRWITNVSRSQAGNKVADYDPATFWRTESPPLDPEFVMFDMGDARTPDAVIVHGHNITDIATTKIIGGEELVPIGNIPNIVAVDFNGVTGQINVVNPTECDELFDNGGSVALWFKARSSGEFGEGRIIHRALTSSEGIAYIETRNESAGQIRLLFVQDFSLVNGNWFSNATPHINLDEWNFLVITYNSNSVANDPIFYINGVQLGTVVEGSTPQGTRTPDDGSDMALAGSADTGIHNYDGLISDTRLYKGRTLTPAEILEQFNGIYNDESNLCGHWKLNEGSGLIAIDTTGNSNNGTLSVGAEWTPNIQEIIPWRAGTMFKYLNTSPRSYRYWRILVEGDELNPDGYIEIGQVYLGSYFEPNRMWDVGTVYGNQFFQTLVDTENMRGAFDLLNVGKVVQLPYVQRTEGEFELFENMVDVIKPPGGTERSIPFYVHVDTASPKRLHYVNLLDGFAWNMNGNYLLDFSMSMQEQL